MADIEYDISTNALRVTKLTENAGISSSMEHSWYDNQTKIKGTIVSEPSYVNHFELSGSGDLHVYQVFEDPYADLDMWYALALKTVLNSNGSNLLIDSYDSGNPLYSTNGFYDGLKYKDTADVVFSSSVQVTNTLGVGKLVVNGYIGGGTTVATLDIGPVSSVGDKLWVLSGNTGIQAGHVQAPLSYFQNRYTSGSRAGSYIMSQSFAPIYPPFTSGMSPTSGDINGVTYPYLFTSSGDYYLPNMDRKMYISESVNCRIYTTNVNMLTTDELRVHASGSVEIFAADPSVVLGGLGIINEGTNPKNCIINGCVNCTTATITPDDTQGRCCLRFPTADVTINGAGGGGTHRIYGHIMAKSLKLNAHFYLHFDENIRRQ